MPRFDRVFRNISSLRAKLARGRKGGNHIEINQGYEILKSVTFDNGREPAEYYRYYSTQRPVDLGTFPKPPGNAPVEIINFDERRMVEGGTMRAWGELAYLKPLTEKQMEDYELRPAPGNPDRAARPSITAQLKEAARRSEAPKEPNKAKHNKSHEDR